MWIGVSEASDLHVTDLLDIGVGSEEEESRPWVIL